jgi:uncharacterized membrane protein YidH (DUF202 family)
MSFQEKSAWIMVTAVLIVYGVYFLTVFDGFLWGYVDVATVTYRSKLAVTTITLIIIAVVAHSLAAWTTPEEADQTDERDKAINRQGEYVGGFVLGALAVMALFLALLELDHFWIANCILLGLVLSELVAGAVKLMLYRRGF